MKNILKAVVFAVFVFGVVPLCCAQNCSGWTNFDLRGTYMHSASGWMDFSKLNPALPAGSVPFSMVGASFMDGQGVGSGWALINAGGVQLTTEMVDVKGEVKPDCSVVNTYSLKVKELGITIGPVTRILVIASPLHGNSDLELYGIPMGAGPGTPVDLSHAKRISLNWRKAFEPWDFK